MTLEHFDVGIIGAGPAGLSAAFALKAGGKSVVIIEEYLWGGTCPNYGCDPKKMLLAAVEAKDQVEHLAGAGVVGDVKLDWTTLMRHKMAFTEPITARKIVGLDEAGIAHRYGHAEFVDDQTVQLPGNTIKANNWIIATGARPARLDVPGDHYLLDNEDFLNLATMPDEITLIGGGFIAIEFANIALAAGAKVHLVLKHDVVLRGFDRDMVATMVAEMTAKGVDFQFMFDTDAVTQTTDGRVTLHATDGRTLTVAAAFLAAGRKGNTDQLNIEAAGVQVEGNGIKVDEYLRTTTEHIYAVGDVANLPVPKLTPTSSAEARYVADHILNPANGPMVFPATPVVVFGSPKLGEVGITEAVALTQGYSIESFDMSHWMGYYRNLEPVAQAKVILDQQGVIVGASVLAAHADELINYFTSAINRKQTQADMRKEMYSYPSLGSDMTAFMGGGMD